MGYILINEADNVLLDLESGHKYARSNIKTGESVIKYGFPIGIATSDIGKGEHVHSHNIRTALSGAHDYVYTPKYELPTPTEPKTILAYERKNGDIGIRNDIFVIPTVGCINKTAEAIARETGAFALLHPYGCSQLGGDHRRTQDVLSGLIKHPNAGGVLVLGLGCENNNLDELKKVLGGVDGERIRFLNAQDSNDELADAVRIIDELKELASHDVRVPVSVSRLRLGLKCGGSDGRSGVTANPLCGKVTDTLVAMGGSAVLTEVPEMFGAEEVLFERCLNEEIFNRAVKLINDYKDYFISHGQPVSENPSPGNKAGGITTLEEKSLGCVTKGGKAVVTDVLDYGDTVTKAGLSLLNGPGNDLVAITNLAAAGCHIILFTTGRGTPLGGAVPTLKISTNSSLAEKKPHWIDYDAEAGSEAELFDLIVETANGKKTKNEVSGFHEISIMKDGVTL